MAIGFGAAKCTWMVPQTASKWHLYLQPETLFKKDSGAVDFLRLFIEINIFFIEQLRVTASKCHFRGSIWSSSWKISKADIISTWYLLGCFFIIAF